MPVLGRKGCGELVCARGHPRKRPGVLGFAFSRRKVRATRSCCCRRWSRLRLRCLPTSFIGLPWPTNLLKLRFAFRMLDLSCVCIMCWGYLLFPGEGISSLPHKMRRETLSVNEAQTQGACCYTAINSPVHRSASFKYILDMFYKSMDTFCFGFFLFVKLVLF